MVKIVRPEKRKVYRHVRYFSAAFLFVLLSVFPVCQAEAKVEPEGEGGRALIVLRDSADSAFLQEMMSCLGWDTATVTEDAWEPGMTEGFSSVITTSPVCIDEILSKELPAVCLKDACTAELTDAVTVSGADVACSLYSWSEPGRLQENFRYLKDGDREMGELTVAGQITAPFLARKGEVICIPFYRAQGLCAVMLGNAMAELSGGRENGKMYLAIDEVYPFSDLNLLCRMADLLYENGIPFIVRVMPVYENLEYPAFSRYAQVLRYVQAKNGTVLIHPALVRQDQPQTEPLSERMSRFTDALEKERVFYVENDHPPFLFSWEWLRGIETETKDFGTFLFPAMFTIPADTDWEQFESFVGQINRKWFSFDDLKAAYTSETFQYNEQPVEAGFEEASESIAGFQSFFDRGDKVLLVVVGAGLAVFMVLIAIGTGWYRKKFIRQNEEGRK